MRSFTFFGAAALVACHCAHTTAFVLPSPSSSLVGRLHKPTHTHAHAQQQPPRRIKPSYQRVGRTATAMVMDPQAISTAVTVAASGAGAAAANASPFVAKIVNNLSSVAVLAVIISVHELGHFLAGACFMKLLVVVGKGLG